MSEWQRLYEFDASVVHTDGCQVVGVDEAGRGPLAGPVVAAAVVLDPTRPIEGIDDSKKLCERRREALYERIVEQALAWSVGVGPVSEIDRINILQASLRAMHRALERSAVPWTVALIDGNRGIPGIASHRQRTVVGGDGLSASIAAASIVAKVTRDRMMRAYDREFPSYEFARHKGYPTRLHIERIRQHGLSSVHRWTFCEKFVAQTVLEL